MVICLLLAAAVALWPLRPRGSVPGLLATGRLAADRLAADRLAAGRIDAGLGPAGPRGRWLGGGTPRSLILAAMACGLGLIFVVTGVAALIAAAAVLATATVLVRQALAQRRERLALVEITAGLRMLGRELRAGAEPAVAAANAGAAAKGAGAEVLRGLTRLTRADDRQTVGSRSAVTGRVPPRGSAVGRGTIDTNAAGSAPQLPDDPRAHAAARLLSGWLLTRRHGLAFTPLIEALAADLSEQIAAEAGRAGQVAGPRMSGYVMAVLPLMGLALGVGMGADPFRVLLLTPVGNALLLVGVLLTCSGLLWSARIVRR